jgi:hypothetical protein
MSFLSVLPWIWKATILLLTVALYFMAKNFKANSTYAKRLEWLVFSMCLGVISSFILWKLIVLPLPTDEYMTKYFNEHRDEFDVLVKAYRESHLLEDPRADWDYSAEIEEIKKKSDVWYVTSVSGMQWHENPYSMEAAEDFRKRRENMSITIDSDRARAGVIVVLNNSNTSSIKELALIDKSYLHIPMIPRIENNKLLYPVDGSKSKYAKQRYIALKSSLNYYPENWERGECFVRPLDAQWFIYLCKAYN